MDNGIIINEHLLASKDKCDSLGVCTKRPKFPSYALRTKREESFKHWPDYLRLDKHDLIDAGLVYTGVGDSVRCYHCGGGLRNWESGDKPMLEHAKWYPDCTHVLLVKGKQYIDAAGRGEDLDVLRSIKAGYEEKKSKGDYHPDLKYIAAQSCLEMGYTVRDVTSAMETFNKIQGHSNFKAVDLLGLILDNEQTDTVTDGACYNTSDSDTDHESDQENEDEIQRMIEENQRIKENQTCKICLEEMAAIIFLPCGHFVSCPQCCVALVKCPVCRIEVKGQVRAEFA